MKNVGILAAMTLTEVGSASDVKPFFNLVVSLLENGIKGSKYPWVTEKLYSGSLTYDEVYKIKCELDSVSDKFSRFPRNNVDLQSFGMDKKFPIEFKWK
ncbi:immunity 70 family protein [Kosakonia sp. HypNH10]|uniref:Imm70 family immunity protein n=1 Tax=Kosakonia sp. HypNH10 TaxID=2980101 RepID=UPI002449167B|nr:Imm70 family immunity protein [Kosakonia sp. HypNH10]MDH2912042.1 immunity 70 family protein [Kosakonia sp. HypNH10]